MKKRRPGLRGTGWDARPDGQLASLFRLQPTPDDICGNKTRDVATREGYICILSPMMMKKKRKKIKNGNTSGFLFNGETHQSIYIC